MINPMTSTAPLLASATLVGGCGSTLSAAAYPFPSMAITTDEPAVWSPAPHGRLKGLVGVSLHGGAAAVRGGRTGVGADTRRRIRHRERGCGDAEPAARRLRGELLGLRCSGHTTPRRGARRGPAAHRRNVRVGVRRRSERRSCVFRDRPSRPRLPLPCHDLSVRSACAGSSWSARLEIGTNHYSVR